MTTGIRVSPKRLEITGQRMVNRAISLVAQHQYIGANIVHMGETQLGGAFEQFATWMGTRGMSENTVKRRRSSFANFARWVAPLPVVEADAELVESWLASFPNSRTRHSYRSDLAAFYEWAWKRKLVATNPMLEVDTIRVPKSAPRPVPIELVPIIIGTCTNGRLRIGLMLAAYAGLRRAEICNLRGDDVLVHAKRPKIIVRNGKGAKDRVVPMHPRLQRSFAQRCPRDLIVPWDPDTLGRYAATHMRDLGYDYTIHQLRASCATEWARLTRGDVTTIARWLGHSDPNTSMGYIDFVDETGDDLIGGMYDIA